MVLNNECVRDLILWIEKNQTVKGSGVPKRIKMKTIYSEFSFSKEDLDTAARYLVDKRLLRLTQDPVHPNLAPKWFVFAEITSLGYEYIAAIKDDTVWKKIKTALGSVSLASVPAVIETAAKFL